MQRAAARGRRAGRLVLDRHPGRLSLHDRQSAHRLVLQDAARRAPGRPIDPLRARPRARRLLLHQRDDLHARTERGLRPLGVTRQRRDGRGTTCCRCSRRSKTISTAPTRCTAWAASCASKTARVRWEILEAWRDAAEECGIPKIREFNRGDNFGSAYFQMNQKRGVRWSATKAFLRPALVASESDGHHACARRARADRQHDGGPRAEGIEFAHPRDGRCFAQADGETILAAGSIGSPQLLQLSGVGPAALLAARGITPVHDARRCRREPARPSSDPDAVQGEEHLAR